MAEFIAYQEGKAGVDAGPATVEQEARRLVQLRNALADYEGKVAQAALQDARRGESEKTVQVPREEWNKWFAEQTDRDSDPGK
jgi:hypothetical protein